MRASAAVRAGGALRFPLKPPGAGGPWNAPTFLVTPTPDGTGVVTHPDVVDFGAGTPWNGFRYWMALTPFSGSNNLIEDPCILVSNDNLTWSIPPGGTNPIDPTPASGFNSDPDLIYGQDGTLYLIYRMTAAADPLPRGDVIFCRTSTDGVTWSGETVIVQVAGNACLSPTICWDGTQYVMYSVNAAASDFIEKRTAATILGTWSAPAAVTITWPGTRTPWHIDCTRSGAKTYLSINEGDNSNQGVRFSVASSTDGSTFTLSAALISPSLTGWDNVRIYRSSGTIAGSVLRLWYSGEGSNDWRAAYTEIPVSALP